MGKKGIRSHSVARTLGITKTLVENWQSAFDRGDYSWTTYAWRKNSEAIALTAVSLYTELKSYRAVAHQLGGMKASTVRRGVSGFLCLGRLFQGQPNEAALCI